MGFSRQEYWSGLPFPSPVYKHGHPPKIMWPLMEEKAMDVDRTKHLCMRNHKVRNHM